MSATPITATSPGTEISIELVQIHDSAIFDRIGGRTFNGIKLPFLQAYPTRTGMVITRAFEQADGQLLVQLFKSSKVVVQVRIQSDGWSIDTAQGF